MEALVHCLVYNYILLLSICLVNNFGYLQCLDKAIFLVIVARHIASVCYINSVKDILSETLQV